MVLRKIGGCVSEAKQRPTLTSPPVDPIPGPGQIVEAVGHETARLVLQDSGMTEDGIGCGVGPRRVTREPGVGRQEWPVKVHAIDPDFVLPAGEIRAMDPSAVSAAPGRAEDLGELIGAPPQETAIVAFGSQPEKRDAWCDMRCRVGCEP